MNESCTAHSRFRNETTLDVFDGLGASSLVGSELTNRLYQVANYFATLRIERTSEAFCSVLGSGEKNANINFCFS